MRSQSGDSEPPYRLGCQMSSRPCVSLKGLAARRSTPSVWPLGNTFKINVHACFAGTTKYKSRLLRAYGTLAVAASIRNPGYRPTCSYRLARPIDMNSLMRAWLVHVCRPGLLK